MKRTKWFFVAGMGVVLLSVALLAKFRMNGSVKPTFVGDSSALKRTVVATTLDTPIPQGQSVIWCGSFQLAWNRLKNDVIKAPVQVQGAETVARQLNSAPFSEADLPKGSYYAAAGFVRDGIVERITRDMARQFPQKAVHQFSSTDPNEIIAYGYLEARALFVEPFDVFPTPMTFTDSSRYTTQVVSFGRSNKGNELHKRRMIEQVKVLYYSPDGKEYAIDPSASTPIQLVLAQVKPEATLTATLASLDTKVRGWQATAQSGSSVKLQDDDALVIPNIAFELSHTFNDLQDKPVLNAPGPGYSIAEAGQSIEFALNRTGAEVKSEGIARQETASARERPRVFAFNRPFLLYMKQRNAAQPFFAMWVDNAELLEPSEE